MPARLTLVLLIVALCCSGAAFAQETFTTVVRGDNVPLLKRPNPDSRKIAILRRGDGIRVTGPAVNLQGDEKPITTESLGVTKRWFVPVEVLRTGDRGWIAEVYVNPRAIAWETPATAPTATVPIATSTPIPTPAPTATSVPTATPQPTPSPTAVPTTLPEPSPTPQPPSSPAGELSYIETISEISATMTASLERFSVLFAAPRLGDASWEAELQAEVDIWEGEYARVLQLTPPPSMHELQDEFSEGLRLTVLSGHILIPALHNLDAAGIERAGELMDEASAHINRATELLQRFSAERGYGS